MSKLNPKPIDIINAAISEIYGEKVLQLVKMCAKLNTRGIDLLIDHAEECSLVPQKYAKAVQLYPWETEREADKAKADTLQIQSIGRRLLSFRC